VGTGVLTISTTIRRPGVGVGKTARTPPGGIAAGTGTSTSDERSTSGAAGLEIRVVRVSL
jgi:hypothetical protein